MCKLHSLRGKFALAFGCFLLAVACVRAAGLRAAGQPTSCYCPTGVAAGSGQPAATPAAANQPVGKAAKIEIPKANVDLETAWNEYFAKLPVPANLALVRQQMASVRETVRQLMNAQKFGEVASLIRGALRNGWGQPWMYEALSLAMQADNQPKPEIERALMSAVAFAHTNNDLMYIAAYMSRAGFDARALKLYRQAAQLDPSRYEPYMHGLQVALRLRDTAGIQWACVGVLSQTWPSDKAVVAELARRAAKATLEQLRAAHQAPEAERFKTALDNAMVRDCIVRVRWDGDAEVDVAVQEPSGSVCSLRNPRTTSGGTLLTGAAARSCQRRRHCPAIRRFRRFYRHLQDAAAARVGQADGRQSHGRHLFPLGDEESHAPAAADSRRRAGCAGDVRIERRPPARAPGSGPGGQCGPGDDRREPGDSGPDGRGPGGQRRGSGKSGGSEPRSGSQRQCQQHRPVACADQRSERGPGFRLVARSEHCEQRGQVAAI